MRVTGLLLLASCTAFAFNAPAARQLSTSRINPEAMSKVKTTDITKQLLTTNLPSFPTTNITKQLLTTNLPSFPTTNITKQLLTTNLPSFPPALQQRCGPNLP